MKICGVCRPEDARAAAERGADFVGAVVSPGFGRSVDPAVAASFFDGFDEAPPLVAVVVDPDPADAARAAVEAGASIVQLHGDEPTSTVRALRESVEVGVWKAVRVRGADDVRRAVEEYGGLVDGILLDGAAAGERGGGHGVRFPWDAASRAREELPPGVVLIAAGGLDPGNVAACVERIEPDVVDVSSGVEAGPRRKDPEKIAAFVHAARNALPRAGS